MSKVFAVLLAALITVVPPTERMTRRIVIVVDRSGSMSTHFDKVLDAVREISQQPTDDMEVTCLAYSSDVRHYGKWVQLPSAEESEALLQWLRANRPSGDTFAAPALRSALRTPRKEISIAFVTDGILNDMPTVLEEIEKGQEWRRENGYSPAPIAVYGFGQEKTTLRQIAEQGKGGYFR